MTRKLVFLLDPDPDLIRTHFLSPPHLNGWMLWRKKAHQKKKHVRLCSEMEKEKRFQLQEKERRSRSRLAFSPSEVCLF